MNVIVLITSERSKFADIYVNKLPHRAFAYAIG